MEQLVGLDAERAKQLTKLQALLSEATARASRLDGDVAQAEQAGDVIRELVAKRSEAYAAYFDGLQQEADELLRMYAPLMSLLENFGPSVAKLRFSVQRRVDLRAWVSVGERLIDQRTTGAFRGRGTLEQVAGSELLGAWESGDGVGAAQSIQRFVVDHGDDLVVMDESSVRTRRPIENGSDR